MWPFSNSERLQTLEDAVEGLKELYEPLSDSIVKLKKDRKMLRLEWEEVFDRNVKLVQRLNKRGRDEAKAELAAEQQPPDSQESSRSQTNLSLHDRVIKRRRRQQSRG